jgi:4-methylaminobutanoate oxidase (formaldehyde-forming)
VDEVYLTTGRWEIEIAGKSYPAMVSARPLYDPKAERTRL